MISISSLNLELSLFSTRILAEKSILGEKQGGLVSGQ
jgi:hypothetical protein